MHGRGLTSFDEVTQAVTSVAVGQQVPVAVARAGQPQDVVLVAQPRPVRPQGPAGNPGAASVIPTMGTDVGDRYATRTQGGRFSPPGDDPTPAADRQPGVDPFLPTAPSRFQSEAAPAPLPARTPNPTATPPGRGVADAWGGMQGSAPQATAPRIPRGPAGRTRVDQEPRGRTPGRIALGVRTVPIDAPTQARFRLPQPSGAYVVGVVGELPASKAGVPPGSVIVALDERPVHSPDELTRLVTGGPVGRPVPIRYVLPGGEQKQAEVVLQSLDLPLEQALVGPETEAVPTPAPRRSERPVLPDDDAEVRALREEVRQLQDRVRWLERRLGGLEPRTP
jgi:hypothetical protein